MSYLILILGDFVLGDFILGDFVLWDFVQKCFCPRGLCPRGFCPRGFCPRFSSITCKKASSFPLSKEDVELDETKEDGDLKPKP